MQLTAEVKAMRERKGAEAAIKNTMWPSGESKSAGLDVGPPTSPQELRRLHHATSGLRFLLRQK